MKYCSRYRFAALSFFVVSLACTSCFRHRSVAEPPAFKDEVRIKTTPVKSQGRSPLCWTYAMLATIESERLMLGDSVSLSPDFLARKWLQSQAQACYLSRGKKGVSLRGMATMTLRLMERYGMEPYDSYHPFDDVNYNVLGRKAMQVARGAASLRQLDSRLGDILDKEIGYLPPSLFMLGTPYTPKQFSESVYIPGEYTALTSFSHHPFGETFVLESPDNQLSDTYYNIGIDELMSIIVGAIRSGHPVCWEGDVTEKGFDFANGVARIDNENIPVTQELRQREYERFRTTDDHCMELCGLARNEHNDIYFIAKNSWGTDNPFGGFMYLSYNYVKLKTIAVVLRWTAMRRG